MKLSRRKRTRSFAIAYEKRFASLKQVASSTELAIKDELRKFNLELHHVAARVKELPSAIAKVRARQYGRPSWQLTDQIGVRVIVYYPEDVDRVANALRSKFEVDEYRSVDKRRELQLRQFGYRSLHILIRLGKELPPQLQKHFSRFWIEVQIRSILEHAWAEIEHEICYKSGITFPNDLLRRFSALAGSLEILDQQFSTLRHEREKLFDDLVARYAAKQDLDKRLDAARLVALLEAYRPAAPGWRVKSAIGRRFPPNSDAVCNDALRLAGITTGHSLLKSLNTATCKKAVAAFASQNAIEPAAVSHFALAVLICSSANPIVLMDYPDLLQDVVLREIVFQQYKKKRGREKKRSRESFVP